MVKKTKSVKPAGPFKNKRKPKHSFVKAPKPDEDNFSENEDFEDGDGNGDDGFNDMEDIPFDDFTGKNGNEDGDENSASMEVDDSVSPAQTQVKSKSKKKATKPLTADELNSLKETEDLFQSNIFKLQIEELLKEVSFKEGRKPTVDRWFDAFKLRVSSFKSLESQPLNSDTYFKKLGVTVPYFLKEDDPKTLYRFIPPTSIEIVGSYALNCASGLNSSVDIRIEIPRECLKNVDHLNFRYLRKRALYLATLAGQLKLETETVSEVRFGCLSGDVTRPYLLINPAGKLKDKVSFRVLLTPPSDFFEAKRFLPTKNNVRTKCITGKEVAEGKEQPTPHYNSLLLADMLASEIESYRESKLQDSSISQAIGLLRVWLKQRELDQALGGFSTFIMSMYLAYLLQERKISSTMNSYQIVRSCLLSLAQAKWATEGISLAPPTSSIPLSQFHENFEVVFVDPSGQLNLCAHMPKATLQRVAWEAGISIGLLNANYKHAFEVLFMSPKPFLLTCDNIIKLPSTALQKINKDLVKAADFASYLPLAVSQQIFQVLERALNKRARLIAVKLGPNEEWNVNEKNSHYEDLEIGLVLDASEAGNLLNKGPLADTPEAADFRKFWGKKSELRRFQDGTVAEAVVWSGPNYAGRRTISKQIVDYILQQHFEISQEEFHYVAHQLESLIQFPVLDNHLTVYGTGEEMELAAIRVTDEFSKQLRRLDNLPLAITAVQGIAPVHRNADVFPNIPNLPRGPKKTRVVEGNRYVPVSDKFVVPTFVKHHDLLITLEASNKWPEEYEAVLRVKTAFYLQLAAQLKIQFNLNTIPHYTHVDVFKDGYVFRIMIAYPREVALLKRVMVDGELQIKDSEQSLELERKISLLPKLTGALHGLHQQQPAYSAAVRLALRWLSCHMLLPYVPEIVVELIMASMFVKPGLYTQFCNTSEVIQGLWHPTIDAVGPSAPQTAFLRFLHFLVNMDWKATPIIVNFDNSLSGDEIIAIEEHFHKNRTSLPPVFIATPHDHSGVAFTKDGPSLPILARIVLLAGESLKLLQTQLYSKDADLKQCFRPPLDLYDIIIHLKPLIVASRNEGLEAGSGNPVQLQEVPPSQDPFPVYNFEPVGCFIKQIRDCYGKFFRIFYDRHGGLHIGLTWIKNAVDPIDFDESQVGGRTYEGNKLVSNIPAMMTDLVILGGGLVRGIQTKSEKWEID